MQYRPVPLRIELSTIGDVTGEQLARRVPLVSSLRLRNESDSTVSGSVRLAVDPGGDPTEVEFQLDPGEEFLRLGIDVGRGEAGGDVIVVTAVAIVEGAVAGSAAGAVVVTPVAAAQEHGESGGRFQRFRRSLSRIRGKDEGPEDLAPVDNASDVEGLVASALSRAVAAVDDELGSARAATEREAGEQAARDAADQAARDQAEREAAEEQARAAADAAAHEAAEQAQREAEARALREADERVARDRAEREAAEQAAREQAEQEALAAAAREEAERAQREAAERAEQERVVREAAEQVARDAAERQIAERLTHEAAEQAAREQAEREAAERAASAPVEQAHPTPRPSTDIPDRPTEPLPGESAFEAWDGGWRGGRIVLDNLSTTANKRLVSAALVEGINGEGPVHVDRLVRLVCASFETRKVTAARSTELAALIPKSTQTTEDGAVLWPARLNPTDWTGFRGAVDAEPRPSEHIPLRELANAMVAVLDANGPMSRDELFGVTRRLFGGKRVTPGVEARFGAALDEAVDQQRLAVDGEQLRPA